MKRKGASYATDPARSRGRLFAEPESASRTVFQRDRDRIVHSTAFRRLKHKTQVFVYHEGDHFRTRLTHSIEVAQVARSMARSLGLDEDLTEALALGHDLGHTPFGHAGERALNRCMAPYGGFDHNGQTLRVVTMLERRYAAFDGLNLTFETLEGLVKHNGPILDDDGRLAGEYRDKGMPYAFIDFGRIDELSPGLYASAEAQVAAIADDIAYNAHDTDDGLRAGLFDLIDLGEVPIADSALAEVLRLWPDVERSRLVHETVRRIISAMVEDVIAETRRHIARLGVDSPAAVHELGEALVRFSPDMAARNRTLQGFLRANMYRHPKVIDMTDRAERIVSELFARYMDDPGLLPAVWRVEQERMDTLPKARSICDFIAGMTDRYAIEEHKRLFDLDPVFR